MRINASNLSLFGFDLSRAWEWWLDGMRQILPHGWSGFFLKTLPCIVVDVDDGSLRLRRRSSSEETADLASLTLNELEVATDGALRSLLGPNLKGAAASTEIVLYLPEESVLLRTMKVPMAARGNLHAMVSYQLPRLTPFQADAVYFDVRIAAVDEAAQSLELEILVALRSLVDPLVMNLTRLLGLPMGRVSTRLQESKSGSFNLLAGAAGRARLWRRLNFNAYLVVILAVVIAAASIAPVYKQRSLVVERKLQLLELNARAADLLEKKQTLDSELTLIDYMVKQRRHSPLSILVELTQVIPDTAFISSFLLTDSGIEIGGAGTGVVDLIDRINSSPLFEGARFTAPLSRDSRTGKDQFRIVFRLRQGEVVQ